MKIALYGNVCNNMYAIARAIKQNSDIDVHLYLADNAFFNNLPENDDPALKNNYPEWIHRSKEFRISSFLFFWKKNILKELRKYDLVILSSLPVLLTPFLKKTNTVFYVTGSDLTVLPFRDIHRTIFYNGKKNNLRPVLYEWLMRRGIRNSTRIVLLPFQPTQVAAKKLNIPSEKFLKAYFPILFNTELFQFRPDANNRLDANVKAQLDKFRFRVFHPSRIVMKQHPHFKVTGQWKQNDLIVKAFAHFIKQNNIKDAGLYFVQKEYAISEIDQIKSLIRELGIEENVIWLKPPLKSGFTRDELINIYSVCDIITDDFGAGWFGSICIEGFCCSKPVISYVDEEAMKELYPWHPFLSSHTAEGNAAFISQVYFNPVFAAEQGKLGRQWAEEFHSFKSGGRIYIKAFKDLIGDYVNEPQKPVDSLVSPA